MASGGLRASGRVIAPYRGDVPAGAGDVRVRDSDTDDLEAIQAIYAEHVLQGLGSFEETPPDLDETARRRLDCLARGLPHLVAVADAGILGFAYAGPYRARPAYRYTVEDSIYLAPAAMRRGIGRALLVALIERCTAAGARQMVAVIGHSGNEGSIGVHRALGFVATGTLRSVGFKHGRWVDVVLMQRALGPGDTVLPGPAPR